jgi:hypothetical protein
MIRVNVAILVFLVAVGALPPTAAFSSGSDYMLVGSFFSYDHAKVFDMDGEGNISVRDEEIYMGNTSWKVTCSPNGKVFTISASGDQYNQVCWVNESHKVEIGDTMGPSYDVFHSDFPYLYHQILGGYESYVIDYDAKQMLPTGFSLIAPVGGSRQIGFSQYMSGIVWTRSVDSLGSFTVNDDGSFTTNTNILWLDEGQYNNLSISPNAKQAAIYGKVFPNLKIVNIQQDGSMFVLQTNDQDIYVDVAEIAYSPNGKFLIAIAIGTLYKPQIVSYSVDQDTGEITLADMILGSVTKWNNPNEITVSPDSKYVLVTSIGLGSVNYIQVVRLHEDGSLEWLPEKTFYSPHYFSDLKFLPLPVPPPLSADDNWTSYE